MCIKILSRDPVQLNLLFEQAKEAIKVGTHPVTLDVGVQLAALLVQLYHGDHNQDKHRPRKIE